MANAKSWRSSEVKYHFKSQGFEFVFGWILGMQTHGASEVGESFFAASQIKDGGPGKLGEGLASPGGAHREAGGLIIQTGPSRQRA